MSLLWVALWFAHRPSGHPSPTPTLGCSQWAMLCTMVQFKNTKYKETKRMAAGKRGVYQQRCMQCSQATSCSCSHRKRTWTWKWGLNCLSFFIGRQNSAGAEVMFSCTCSGMLCFGLKGSDSESLGCKLFHCDSDSVMVQPSSAGLASTWP